MDQNAFGSQALSRSASGADTDSDLLTGFKGKDSARGIKLD